MRRLHWSLALVGAALAAPAPLASQVPAGTPYDEYEEYGVAVSEFYGMPLERMSRRIDPDELPVIYLLAREARVSPRLIIALRERGWSWIDITYELGVDPYLYVERLPYSSGYWRRYSAWELRYLTDRHIIDYVNLCFWADYHRRPLTQVIVIRERVPTWRYYVRHHAPPRTVARGVYVVRTPPPARRYDPPRGVTRTAVPRDDSRRDDPQRRAIARDGRDDERRSPTTSQPTTSRPAQGVRRDPSPPNGVGDRGGEGVRRDQPPSRTGSGTARPADDVRREQPPSRAGSGTARPSEGVRRESSSGSGSSARPAQGATRSGTAQPRSTAAPQRSGSAQAGGTRSGARPRGGN